MSEGHSDPIEPQPPMRVEKSRLAVAAGVMGLVSLPFFCCGSGMAGVIAAALGMLALERIKSSGGTLRGKGWAWTGVASGLASVALSLVWVSVASAAMQQWNRELDDGLRLTFAGKTDELARDALPSWASRSGPGVSAASLSAFAVSVHDRLGDLQSVSLISQDASAGRLEALMVVHEVKLEFAEGSRSAVVSSELRTPVLAWTPRLKLVKIYLNDAEVPGGMVEFPAAQARPAGTGGSAAPKSTADGDKEVAP